MNIFDFKEYKVLIDFAHNADGFRGIKEFLSGVDSPYKIGIITGTGLIILVDGTHMRNTNLTDVEIGEPVSIENLIVHVMSIGDHFDLKTKRLTIDHFKPKVKQE